MATLQAAIDEIQDLVGAISGIRKAPDEPPDQASVFPFAVCYASSGNYSVEPAGEMKGLHNLNLELHVARKDQQRDVQKAMAYAKSIPNALFNNAGSWSSLDTVIEIDYSFGPLGYGGLDTLGFRFVVSIKTHDILA